MKCLHQALEQIQQHVSITKQKTVNMLNIHYRLAIITLSFLDFILEILVDLEGVNQGSDRVTRAGKTNVQDSNSTR